MVGLGLRPDGLDIVHVEHSEGQSPRLKVCSSIDCREQREQSRVLHDAARQYGLPRGRCVGVLSAASYSLLQVEPPPVPEAELRGAVRWQIRDLISFPIEEAVVDVFLVPNPGNRTRNPLAYVVAAPKSVVRRQVDLILGARMKVAAIDIPEMALRNLASFFPEDAKGVATLYLGPEGGVITISREGNLFLARGINISAAALASFCDDAGAVDPLELEPRLQDLLDSIVLEIQRSLDFYESNFGQAPIGTLVVMPTEQNIPPLLPYLKSYLGVQVRSFDLGTILDCPELPDGQDARSLLAIGAALRQESGEG